MIRKRLITLMTGIAMALGVVFVAASPAQAAEWNYTVDVDWEADPFKECFSGWEAGSACVQPSGDIIWIKDNNADGHGVYVTWEDGDGDRSGTCWNRLGKAKGWTWCNKDFPEGHTIYWRMNYYTDSGGPYSTQLTSTEV